MISHQPDLDMDEAFDVLRRFSRDRNGKLADTAKGNVDRSLDDVGRRPR